MFLRDSGVLMVLVLIAAAAVAQYLLSQAKGRVRLLIRKDQSFAPLLLTSLGWAYNVFSILVWLTASFGVLASLPQTQEVSVQVLDWGQQAMLRLKNFFFDPMVKLGRSEISVFNIFQVFIFIIVIALLARTARKVLLNRILSQTPLDLGIRHAVATFTQYVVITIGFLIGLQTAGIDLSALTILAGAVGVGVGFGLQNIANNFISGIIILFERPIKIGDRIEVGDVNGDVVHIAARSTTVRTNDNIAIIIPNSSFIASNVINWSHGDAKVRFRLPVSVSYDSDVHLVERILMEVAKENENVLEDPPTRVIFLGFGDSALNFELRIWTSRLLHRRGVLFSQLNFAIFDKFKEHGVQIPFPQRDLHVKSVPSKLQSFLEPDLAEAEPSGRTTKN